MNLKFLKDYCEWYVLVGSRVTCNPPPTDTDQDVLVYTHDENTLTSHLLANGWTKDKDYDLPAFISYKKEDYNIIATPIQKWAIKFLKATKECKKNNVMDKAERIKVFDKYMKKASMPKPPAFFKTLDFAALEQQYAAMVQAQQVMSQQDSTNAQGQALAAQAGQWVTVGGSLDSASFGLSQPKPEGQIPGSVYYDNPYDFNIVTPSGQSQW